MTPQRLRTLMDYIEDIDCNRSDAEKIIELFDFLHTLLEAQPIVWRWLYEGKPDTRPSACFDGSGPDSDIEARALAAEFPRTVQQLYQSPWEPQR